MNCKGDAKACPSRELQELLLNEVRRNREMVSDKEIKALLEKLSRELKE